MSISFVNVNNQNKPKLFLCKPNRTTVGKLNDRYNTELTINSGGLNELTFSVPIKVERNNVLATNPIINKLYGKYEVRLEWNGTTEYFTIHKINKSTNEQEYTCSLLNSAHTLSSKLIIGYELTYETLTHLASDMLSETTWTVGYVDVDFDIKSGSPNHRGFEVDEANVLQCLFDLATKFGALIEFDSVNKKVNFVKPENTGVNKGFKIRDGIFLDSLNAEINYDEVVTRLYVYGEDGLEFRRLSPTGSNFIQSFDYYMYPFESDDNYNVIKSSIFMSDELCVKIRKYEDKISLASPRFESLTTQMTNKQDEIIQREQELSDLKIQLNLYLNQRDVINATYMDNAPSRQDWQTVINNINNQNNLITAKNNQIATLESQLEVIENELNDLRDSIRMDNPLNFTSANLIELDDYIVHKTYRNDSISDEQDLLEDGLRAFKEYNVPPTSLSIDLVNFLQDFEYEKIRDRIAINDTVTAKIKDLDLDLSMKINQIKYNFDSDSINLTVTNLKDLRDDWEKFLATLQTANNTSTTVDMSKHLWNTVSDTNTTVDKILNSEYDTAKNVLKGGVNSTIEISDRGIYNRETNGNGYMVMNAGIIAWSNDNGNSISVSISKNGVHADKVFGKMILSNRMWIESASGIVDIQNEAVTIKNNVGTHLLTLGRYTLNGVNKHGLYVRQGAVDIRTSDNDNRGLQLDSNGVRTFNNNGVRTFNVDATTGLVSIIGSMSIKTSSSSYAGVEITPSGIKGYGSSGQVNFELDATTGKTTVQTSFLFQTSKESNRGVKISEAGIYGYNSSGTSTFSINASTGSAYFMGDINASNITGGTIQTTSTSNRGIKIQDNGLSLYNTSGSRTVYLNGTDGSASFTGSISSSTFTGGSINIGNGVFTVNSDGSATMTKASISTSAVNGKYITLSGSRIEGGDFTYGTSYTLGTAEFAGLFSYRSGVLQLDDYNSNTATSINRRMQLASNTVMVQGSNLVLGGASQSRPTIITRQVGSSHHDMTVQSNITLQVVGGINATGNVYSNGEQLATISYVQDLISNL